MKMLKNLLQRWLTLLNIYFNAGCTRIILACNNSHLFLNKIYEVIPEIKGIIHIIDNCENTIKMDGVESVYLLGSEGTIESHIYQNALEAVDIKCVVPKAQEYGLLRECIEAVKQNKYDEHIKGIFLNLVCRHDTCILGCTELPILYEKYRNEIKCSHIYDPLFLALLKLKGEYDNE